MGKPASECYKPEMRQPRGLVNCAVGIMTLIH